MTKIIKHEGETFKRWDYPEIYQGQTDGGEYHVPNLDDEVVDESSGIYRVKGYDTTGKIAVLELWYNPFKASDDDTLDAGLSRNYARNSNRAFFDSSGSKNVVTIDRSTYIYDSDAVRAKLFQGSDTSTASGTVISRVYDSNDQFIGDTVTLYNAYSDSSAIKICPQINVDVDLKDGDVVTLVVYTATGGRVYEEGFNVRTTTALRSDDAAVKYLTGVELISDLIDPAEPDVVRNDVGIPLTSSQFECKLIYNDASTKVIGIDGIKCILMGVKGFNNSLLGFAKNLTLAYYPEDGENAINLSQKSNRAVCVKNYRVINKTDAEVTTFKLYVIPFYVSSSAGYTFKFYLTDSLYDIIMDVTDNVDFTDKDGGPVLAAEYETTQDLMAIIKIRDVLPAYPIDYKHVQLFKLYLDKPTMGSGTAWNIDYLNDGTGQLGEEARMTYYTFNDELDIQNGDESFEDWIDRHFYRAIPLYDDKLSNDAPEPTHFQFIYEDESTSAVFEIASWNNPEHLAEEREYSNYETVTINWLFYRSEEATYDTIGVTPMLLEVVG